MTKSNVYSYYAYCIIVVLVLWSSFGYEGWRAKNTQNAYSYDAMGYYTYLPALFIYDDLAHFKFLDDIIPKYEIWGNAYRPKDLANGNVVDKYAVGMAVFQAPAFGVAHVVAKLLGYPADGFSVPYHAIVSLWNILFALFALWYLRRLLLLFFTDAAVACSLLLLLVATNYWLYVGYDNHLTHVPLFSLYVFLLYYTIKWHRQPALSSSVAIGSIIGLAVLIRPTEIVSVFIPLLWNLDINLYYNTGDLITIIKSRFLLFVLHYKKLLLAALFGGAIIFIQLLYWKTVTGQWVYYSYDDQKLEFLRPHITSVLYSYKKGWLVYTPIMALALLGFVPLYKQQKSIFWAILAFFIANFYLVSCWSVWWYGGGFGQRALIQSYVFLLFPLTAFWVWALQKRVIWLLLMPLVTLFVWLNVTQTFCPILDVENNTKTYYWHVFGKTQIPKTDRKYLQIDEKFTDTNYTSELLYSNRFEQDTVLQNSGMLCLNPLDSTNLACQTNKQTGLCSPVLRLDTLHRRTPDVVLALSENQQKSWIRVHLNVLCLQPDYNFWQNHTVWLSFMQQQHEVKSTQLRLVPIIDCGVWTPIVFDTKIPETTTITQIKLHIGDGSTPHPLYIDDVVVERLY